MCLRAVARHGASRLYLKASNTEAGDDFGGSVAISGDTVVVVNSTESSNSTGVNGSQANNSAFLSGAAYVFTRNGTTWSQQAYLKASNTAAIDFCTGSQTPVLEPNILQALACHVPRSTSFNNHVPKPELGNQHKNRA